MGLRRYLQGSVLDSDFSVILTPLGFTTQLHSCKKHLATENSKLMVQFKLPPGAPAFGSNLQVRTSCLHLLYQGLILAHETLYLIFKDRQDPPQLLDSAEKNSFRVSKSNSVWLHLYLPYSLTHPILLPMFRVPVKAVLIQTTLSSLAFLRSVSSLRNETGSLNDLEFTK